LSWVLPVDVGNVTCSINGAAFFADADAGQNKTVTAAVVLNGSAAGNYQLPPTASGTASINPAHLTVAAVDQEKTYDGEPFSPFTAIITGFVNDENSSVVSGSAAFGGDAAGAVNAGEYTITPSLGSLTAVNYVFVTFNSGTLKIHKANAIISVTGYSGVYDGAPHGAIGSAIGVEASPTNLSSLLNLGSAFTNVPGGMAHWIFDGDGNYNAASGDVAVTLSKADAHITVTGYSGVYDGAAHGASGSATGVEANPADLKSLLHLGSTFTNVPGGTAHWTFDGNDNYNATSGDVPVTLVKADAHITVTGYSGVYDGAAHGASGLATGVEAASANLGGLLHLGSSFTNVPGGTASWTFDGDVNYNFAAGSVAIVITPRPATWTTNPNNKILGSLDPNPLTTGSGNFLAVDGVTATYSRVAGENVGAYHITAILSATGLLSNYSVTNTGADFSIIYAPSGMCLGDAGHAILQPINADGSSVFKQGSTVPAKFRVCDANGASVGTPGVVASFRLVGMTASTGAVDETVVSTTPDTDFRWSATDQQWIFNMGTKSLPSGKKYYYAITLKDGSTITFNFSLK
jgi:MBG domain-containing protein/YDG domain-containing protein